MHSERAAGRQLESRVSAAFVGWQLGAGEKGQTFNGYLKHMGLMENVDVMTEEEKERMLTQADRADQVCRQWFDKNVKGKK